MLAFQTWMGYSQFIHRKRKTYEISSSPKLKKKISLIFSFSSLVINNNFDSVAVFLFSLCRSITELVTFYIPFCKAKIPNVVHQLSNIFRLKVHLHSEIRDERLVIVVQRTNERTKKKLRTKKKHAQQRIMNAVLYKRDRDRDSECNRI